MKLLTRAKQNALFITILYCVLLAGACNSSAPVPEATSITDTAITVVPSLTSTSEPTLTFQPTATAVPLPSTTPLAADLGQVIFSESFDDMDFPFMYIGPVRIESGIAILEREKGYKPPDGMWPFGGMSANFPVAPGAASIALFKTTGGANFNIGYHTGDYGSDSLRRFSYNSGKGTWDLYTRTPMPDGSNPIKSWDARQRNFTTWHYFMIKRSTNGDIEAKIWEKDKPQATFSFKTNLGAEWGTLDVHFFVDYHGGSFQLDEYQELQ